LPTFEARKGLHGKLVFAWVCTTRQLKAVGETSIPPKARAASLAAADPADDPAVKAQPPEHRDFRRALEVRWMGTPFAAVVLLAFILARPTCLTVG
jgi:hypothetical protein